MHAVGALHKPTVFVLMDDVGRVVSFPMPVKDQRLPVVASLDAPALKARVVPLGGHLVPLPDAFD